MVWVCNEASSFLVFYFENFAVVLNQQIECLTVIVFLFSSLKIFGDVVYNLNHFPCPYGTNSHKSEA